MIDFTTVNNSFDHIYVITLKRATARQEALRTNLAGLNFEFFWGEDKQEHSLSELVTKGIYDETGAKKNHRYHKNLSEGQICCAWSHRKVYQDMLAQGYARVLILEDDVFAHQNIETLAPFILKEIPPNWELLYLDYAKNETPNSFKRFWYHIQHGLGGLTWNHTMINNLYPKRVSNYIATAGFHDFTSAYAITALAAAKLVQLQTPITYLADNLLATACTNKTVNGFIARPKLFSQLSQGADKQTHSFVDE